VSTRLTLALMVVAAGVVVAVLIVGMALVLSLQHYIQTVPGVR
jgi:hypothetical protein